MSGSFGAGHDAAAGAIASQLHERGLRTRTWDVVDLLPAGLGRAVRWGYLQQVRSVPATWRWLLEATERRPGAAALTRLALRCVEEALLDIAAGRPDAVVSTHPFASQALGRLRADGRVTAPVFTFLTDMSVHRLWVHPGVDGHLAIHDLPAAQARRHGARSVVTVRPAVPAAFSAVRRLRNAQSQTARGRMRHALGLPCEASIALLTGGSCGIGRLLEAALDVAAAGMTPVVLCGSNAALAARVRRRGLGALDWVADMPRLLSVVDVVVQNAGGITSLESAAAGVPVVTYRCVPGHGEANAAALDAAGAATWVRRPGDLSGALRAALRAGPGADTGPAPGADVADHLLPLSALTA